MDTRFKILMTLITIFKNMSLELITLRWRENGGKSLPMCSESMTVLHDLLKPFDLRITADRAAVANVINNLQGFGDEPYNHASFQALSNAKNAGELFAAMRARTGYLMSIVDRAHVIWGIAPPYDTLEVPNIYRLAYVKGLVNHDPLVNHNEPVEKKTQEEELGISINLEKLCKKGIPIIKEFALHICNIFVKDVIAEQFNITHEPETENQYDMIVVVFNTKQGNNYRVELLSCCTITVIANGNQIQPYELMKTLKGLDEFVELD